MLILCAMLVISALWVSTGRRGRPRACQRAAAQLRLRFSVKDKVGAPNTCPHSLFRQGGGGRGTNIMWGDYRGVGVMCFDYSFTTPVVHPKEYMTIHTSYALCALVGSPVVAEAVMIRPRTFDDNFGFLLGETNIHVGSAEFDRHFVVQCADRGLALTLLSPPLMDLLLAHRGPHVEFGGDSILLYLPQGASGKVACDVEKMLQLGCEIVALMPVRTA